eukprot:TRINITY_DN35266_c0_g1_i1.p1 TRINITY_DN35266_c0_g1~~TRINITY_DN35266_c0_g1_i1.p1  ORF type:complete len:818 (-),score=211.02 TRINITY_DN35266_c0_g1_i1:195-2363(-)
MDVMTRVDAEEKAKIAGAKVMGNVSGNTVYLVVGSHLDDGRAVEETSKYRKVEELKAKGKKHPQIINEAEFLKLLGAAPAAPAPMPPVIAATGGSSSSSTAPAKAKATAGDSPSISATEHANWVDSYAPKNFEQLVGNNSVVRKLTEWLRDWDDVVLKGKTKKAGFKPGGGMPDNINARAALISGPPGIGKTTSSRLVAQQVGGYEILEFNASDARGQKIINEMAAGLSDNRTLNFSGGLGEKKVPALTKRTLIIMDEVDGMGAGDRGGMAALIKMIKKTKNPIICICNDSHSPKVRSLAFSCYDLKFSRPTKTTVAQRCAQIAAAEGLEVEQNALEALAESCGSDMRMVLNQLQMLAKSQTFKTQGVKYMDMKERMHEMAKDQGIMLSSFDACKKLLNSSEGARLSFRDRIDMFFVDHSIMGLLVHENYLSCISKKPVTPELLQKTAYSAELMAVGDVINGRVRDYQDWSLLPDLAILSAVYPAYLTNGFVSFPSFPAFLGKYSTQSRMRRLATELQTHLRLTSTASRASLTTTGFSDLLYRKMLSPLLRGNPEAVLDTVAVLDAYGLRKEHLQEHLSELRTHLGGDDLFKVVDPKVKAAMTREFNTGHHAVKVVLPKGTKRKAVEENPDDVGDDVEQDKVKAQDEDKDGSDVEEEKEKDDKLGGLIKIKGGAKAKAKGKAQAKSRSKGSSEVVLDNDVTAAEAAPKARGKAKAKSKSKAR